MDKKKEISGQKQEERNDIETERQEILRNPRRVCFLRALRYTENNYEKKNTDISNYSHHYADYSQTG